MLEKANKHCFCMCTMYHHTPEFPPCFWKENVNTKRVWKRIRLKNLRVSNFVTRLHFIRGFWRFVNFYLKPNINWWRRCCHCSKACLVCPLFLYLDMHRWLPRYSHLTYESKYSVLSMRSARYKQEKQVQLEVVLIRLICTRVALQVPGCTLAR